LLAFAESIHDNGPLFEGCSRTHPHNWENM
jgi:hypothetical protein